MNQEKQNASVKDSQDGEKNMKKEILSWVFYILFVVALTYVIITFVGQRTRVDGRSMMNTLSDGDNLIVEKLSYRFGDPERFDIIVFRPYENEKEYYIKRIIGLPGETVQIVDGEIYINGELLEESYGREVMQDAGLAAEPITLGDDEYFVLGDNRNYSSDSRDPSVALIHRKEIIGRAWLRIWPLNSFGILKHQ